MDFIYDNRKRKIREVLEDTGRDIPSDLMPPKINGVALDCVIIIQNMSTQWDYLSSGMGVPQKLGLKYEALDNVANGYDIKLKKYMFRIIQSLERIVLAKSREESKNEQS